MNSDNSNKNNMQNTPSINEEYNSIFDDTLDFIEVTEEMQNEINQKEKPNNIKNFIIKKSRILPIIAFLFVLILGIYVLFNNINSSRINLIKIEENDKIGYINNKGKVIIKPKYLYGTDFYKGYAIVKNYNNLYGIVNSKGKAEIPFGNIFSANLYSDRYVVSKFTNNGLKMGLLDSNLKEVTRFKYDNISYSKLGLFVFTYDDTMGIMNKDGKEIYSYKVDEVDNKNISIDISNVNDKTYTSYAVIKVNTSSTIINTKTGKEVYKYTLDDIKVLDNNVFYIQNEEGNNKYLVVKNDKIVFETEDYLSARIEDITSDILICIGDDSKTYYINLLNKETINTEGDASYTYSDGVILQQIYDFEKNKTVFTVLTPKKNISTFENVLPVDNTFVNGFMKIKLKDDKYSFINKKGNIISDGYDNVSDFNENGFAIVNKNRLYGVIDTNGKVVVDIKYEDIKLFDSTLFNNIYKKTNKKVFIIKDNNKYGIIDSNKKIVLNPKYDDFDFITKKYLILKVVSNEKDILINLYNFKQLKLKVNDEMTAYEDYIKIGNYYYNYDGELIYPLGG